MCSSDLIINGGWHFCNLKTPEKLSHKYKNLCETDDPIIFKEKIDEKFLNLESIEKKILSGSDIIGRNDQYGKVAIDHNFPKYLVDNLSVYKDWVI